MNQNAQFASNLYFQISLNCTNVLQDLKCLQMLIKGNGDGVIINAMFLFYGPKLLPYIAMYYYPDLLILHVKTVHMGMKLHDSFNCPVLIKDIVIQISYRNMRSNLHARMLGKVDLKAFTYFKMYLTYRLTNINFIIIYCK